MSDILTITALVSSVTIRGFSSDEQPLAQGLASKSLGTIPSLDTSATVSASEAAAFGGRLATELSAHISGGTIQVTLGGQVMTAAEMNRLAAGYLRQRIGFNLAGKVSAITGTWTESYAGSGVWEVARTAAAAAQSAAIDIPTSVAGMLVSGIELTYKVETALVTDVDVVLYKATSPEDGSAPAGASISASQTYDAGHDTSAERGAVAQHTMEVLLAAPTQVAEGENLTLEVEVDGTATGDVTLQAFCLIADIPV